MKKTRNILILLVILFASITALVWPSDEMTQDARESAPTAVVPATGRDTGVVYGFEGVLVSEEETVSGAPPERDTEPPPSEDRYVLPKSASR